ncbi:MAG: hypothetical protein HKN12_06970, partial [Gemmatimonadetes bacterium]|nr:hypothetical protein [Gemmatimonadota bacterium]
RLHAARALSSPRKFGPIKTLREDAERDMFARDVRELFLLPYAEARRTGRLRGPASGILGPVLSSNASVALDAMLARGCFEPGPALQFVLEEMLERSTRRGFFYEPFQVEAKASRKSAAAAAFVLVTAAYARYLIAFGLGRDPRIARAFDWLASQQDEDGAWREGRTVDFRGDIGSYLLTRAVAQAFAELPVRSVRRYAETRRRLAGNWASRILPACDDPDAVLPWLDITSDPRGNSHGGPMPELPDGLRDRILYFPMEDLWLALKVGADPDHPNLKPWLDWLRDTQLADGSWRLGDPSLRERLLLSDPNGRLRAEALFLTDEWITLRGAQILQLAARPQRARVATAS